MTIKVHRGISQIGGCVTEIASESGTKILIDLGHNLPEGDGLSYDRYESDKDLTELLDGVSDIYYTHYHGDHIAFESRVGRNVSQHIGALSLKMLITLKEHMQKAPAFRSEAEKDLEALSRFIPYKAQNTEYVGDIEITPFFVSHSAIDAYMFLIKCDGKCVLHTGDFRDHGWMGNALLRNIDWNIVRNNVVDVLITEGTMLGRGDERVMTEKELLFKAKEVLTKKKYAFVLCSSMDADRIVSFYHANEYLHEHRLFVADSYQIEQIKNVKENLSGIYGDICARNIWHNQDSLLVEMQEHGFVMLIRCSDTYKQLLDKILPHIDLQQTVLFYSQFGGYINPRHKAFKESLYQFVHRYEWDLIELHTSGHACKETLSAVCNHVDPQSAIIPIHREADTDFAQLDIKEGLKNKIVTETGCFDDIQIIIKRPE